MPLNSGTERTDQDMYIDTVKMLDSFSKDSIYKEPSPPYTQTLFIELIQFSPNQPDTVLANNSSSVLLLHQVTYQVTRHPPKATLITRKYSLPLHRML
jgi:histone demethylase JARID1